MRSVTTLYFFTDLFVFISDQSVAIIDLTFVKCINVFFLFLLEVHNTIFIYIHYNGYWIQVILKTGTIQIFPKIFELKSWKRERDRRAIINVISLVYN